MKYEWVGDGLTGDEPWQRPSPRAERTVSSARCEVHAPRPSLAQNRASQCMYINARPPVPLPRNVHCALDDASVHTAPHRDRYVNACGPLAIDMWRCSRASLVL